MAGAPSEPARDLEWKRNAVKAFRRVAATDEQKQCLMEEGVAIDRPATEQTDRLDAILVRAEVEVLDNFRAEKTLSSGDKTFLKSKGIKPDTPAADQDARLALVAQLATQRQATATFDSIVEEVSADTVKERLTTDQRVLVSRSGADWKWQDDGLKGRITATLDKNREIRSLKLSKKENWTSKT